MSCVGDGGEVDAGDERGGHAVDYITRAAPAGRPASDRALGARARTMSDAERDEPHRPRAEVASMESILESVAQPVWVVDHDGLVVFVNPAGLAALGYDDLSELKRALRPRRHPLQAPRRLALPGRGLPDDEGPRDRRDDPHGRGLVRPPRRLDVPGLLHGDAARAARRAGRGRRLQGHRGAARGRAGAARARGDPRQGRPAGVGHRRRRVLPLRQSGRAGRARLRGGLRPGGPARSRHGPLQVPRRHAVPRGRLPARPGPQGGEGPAGHRGLARAQGRLDRAGHLLVGAVRAARTGWAR